MKKLPKDAYIKDRKEAFRKATDRMIKTKLLYDSQRETIRHKLDLIKEELIKFKDLNMPYRVLAAIIREHFQLELSEQTLRSYCINQLGFPARKRGKKTYKSSTFKQKEVEKPLQPKTQKESDERVMSTQALTGAELFEREIRAGINKNKGTAKWWEN